MIAEAYGGSFVLAPPSQLRLLHYPPHPAADVTVGIGAHTDYECFTILLADQSGNPVADGTPIVFQTNLGAIGSSDKGGCNTVNGGCAVDFRTQAPRFPTKNQPATPCNTAFKWPRAMANSPPHEMWW